MAFARVIIFSKLLQNSNPAPSSIDSDRLRKFQLSTLADCGLFPLTKSLRCNQDNNFNMSKRNSYHNFCIHSKRKFKLDEINEEVPQRNYDIVPEEVAQMYREPISIDAKIDKEKTNDTEIEDNISKKTQLEVKEQLANLLNEYNKSSKKKHRNDMIKLARIFGISLSGMKSVKRKLSPNYSKKILAIENIVERMLKSYGINSMQLKDGAIIPSNVQHIIEDILKKPGYTFFKGLCEVLHVAYQHESMQLADSNLLGEPKHNFFIMLADYVNQIKSKKAELIDDTRPKQLFSRQVVQSFNLETDDCRPSFRL